jgi:sulfide:quinone oxidoreductase
LTGVPAVRNAIGLVDERGLVKVDEYLRNPAYPNVFAIGACVAHPPPDPTPVPVGAPDSVYSITQAGKIVVQNILAQLGDAALISHVTERARWLSDMGNTGATYLSEPQVPLRDINWLRQGRWVHQAKVDFEKYFVNKIRLMPAGQAPSVPTRIASVMGQLLAEQSEGRAPSPAPAAQGSGKPLDIHLPRDAVFELTALASTLGRDPGVLAAELLIAALSDAKICLSDTAIEALAYARRELLVAELPERQPGVEFHGGGT